jgi:hypothetical protein
LLQSRFDSDDWHAAFAANLDVVRDVGFALPPVWREIESPNEVSFLFDTDDLAASNVLADWGFCSCTA